MSPIGSCGPAKSCSRKREDILIMLIRFSPMTTSHCVMLPFAAVEPVIGRAFAVRADAEQRAEGVERVKTAVKAEGKFVQVGLQVLVADRAVMRAAKPSLEVRKDKAACAGFGRRFRTGSGQAGAGIEQPTCRASCSKRG